MKKLLFAAVAFVATAASLSAQSLTITAPGYSASKLFDSTAGFTITGFASDGVSASGDVYYLETDTGAFTASTKLYKRTSASGYAPPAAPLLDLGSVAFGSFVTFSADKILFGESSTNKIYAINPDGSGLDLLGTVPNNFDAAFRGGSLFVSHNPTAFPSPPANKISKFDLDADGGGGLMLSAGDLILDTGSDYSGPIEFDSTGALYYGASGANGLTGLYRYNPGEVSAAFGPTNLLLDAGHRQLENGANATLAWGGEGLWQSNYSTLNLITGGLSAPVGTSGDSIGQLDFSAGQLFANVTDFSTSRSSIYRVVPEPSTLALLAAGLVCGASRRRFANPSHE